MAVTLVFLGKLADHEGAGERNAEAPLDYAGMLARLSDATVALIEEGKVHVALDGAVLPDPTALSASDGSEVALLPPVSGG